MTEKKEPENVKTTDPTSVPEKKEEKKTEEQEVLEKAQAILAQYGGLEGQIPTDNEYWGLMNTYRGLLSKKQQEK